MPAVEAWGCVYDKVLQQKLVADCRKLVADY